MDNYKPLDSRDLNEYLCGDIEEKDFLLSEGLEYSYYKSNCGFDVWKFEKCDELYSALKKYCKLT